MERMTEELLATIAQLEEENKKLRDDIKKWEDRWMVKLAEIYVMPTKYLTTAIAKNEWYSSWYDTVKRKMLHDLGFDRLDIQDLLKENKKLNIKVASLEGEIKGLNSTIDKLKEENQTLELWLDNKEKLNEKYRKQIDKLRTDNIYEEGLYD